MGEEERPFRGRIVPDSEPDPNAEQKKQHLIEEADAVLARMVRGRRQPDGSFIKPEDLLSALEERKQKGELSPEEIGQLRQLQKKFQDGLQQRRHQEEEEKKAAEKKGWKNFL